MEGPSKGLRKGAWTAEEDGLLRKCIDKYGEGKWHQVPLRAGLNRCRKSCRLRWLNYLKPSIKRGKLSSDEVDLLLRLHKLLGNRWSLIAGRLPGRTANDVKNYWNTHLSKKHEPCCKIKIKKRNIPCSLTTVAAQIIDVVKPRPRSFKMNNGCSHFNGRPEVHDVTPPCLGLNNSPTTSNKGEELVNHLMDGENMWLELLLHESQDTFCSTDSAPRVANATEKGATSSSDVEQLWSLLDGETVELH